VVDACGDACLAAEPLGEHGGLLGSVDPLSEWAYGNADAFR
jgi:hypothetical protein